MQIPESCPSYSPAIYYGDRYYFTGAIDLFPIETAKLLADEVLVTYPKLEYNKYEVLAISSSFGFNPAQAAWRATQQPGVGWIHNDGIVNFDPKLFGISMINKIPRSYTEYGTQLESQYTNGFNGAFNSTKKFRGR